MISLNCSNCSTPGQTCDCKVLALSKTMKIPVSGITALGEFSQHYLYHATLNGAEFYIAKPFDKDKSVTYSIATNMEKPWVNRELKEAQTRHNKNET